MENTTPNLVLEHIISIIKNAIPDIKIEYISTSIASLKDGNDSIYLEQTFDSSSNFTTIIIKDPKDIIFSEDLLPLLRDLAEGTSGKLATDLQKTTVIVNDLDIETFQVLETAKDTFDQLSSSYEFIKTIEKDHTKVISNLKFGNHAFVLTIINEPGQVFVTSDTTGIKEAGVKNTINADTSKVQSALQTLYKEG